MLAATQIFQQVALLLQPGPLKRDVLASILAWRTAGTEAPGGLPSMGSHRVGHDWSDLAAAAAAKLKGFKLVSCCQLFFERPGSRYCGAKGRCSIKRIGGSIWRAWSKVEPSNRLCFSLAGEKNENFKPLSVLRCNMNSQDTGEPNRMNGFLWSTAWRTELPTYLQCWLHMLAVSLDTASLRFSIFRWGLLQLPWWRVGGDLLEDERNWWQ